MWTSENTRRHSQRLTVGTLLVMQSSLESLARSPRTTTTTTSNIYAHRFVWFCCKKSRWFCHATSNRQQFSTAQSGRASSICRQQAFLGISIWITTERESSVWNKIFPGDKHLDYHRREQSSICKHASRFSRCIRIWITTEERQSLLGNKVVVLKALWSMMSIANYFAFVVVCGGAEIRAMRFFFYHSLPHAGEQLHATSTPAGGEE